MNEWLLLLIVALPILMIVGIYRLLARRHPENLPAPTSRWMKSSAGRAASSGTSDSLTQPDGL